MIAAPSVLEAVVLALLASLFWAPALVWASDRLAAGLAPAGASRLRAAAAALAALPVLGASLAAAGGISLRPAPVLAPIAAPAPAPILAPGFPPESRFERSSPDRTPAPASVAPSDPASIAGDAAVWSAPAIASRMNGGDAVRLLALIYAYGLALSLGVVAFRQGLFAVATGDARPSEDADLEATVDDWARRLGLRARPRIRVWSAGSTVCLAGVFRPAILIPADLLDRVGQHRVALMAAHELAHWTRGDHRLFAALRLLRSAFWFNPAVGALAARAEAAAEEAADALVLAAGAPRRDYAASFVAALRFAADRRAAPGAFAPAFTPDDPVARRRRLAAIRARAVETRPRRAGLALAGAAGLLLAGLQAALAAPAAPEVAAPVAPPAPVATAPAAGAIPPAPPASGATPPAPPPPAAPGACDCDCDCGAEDREAALEADIARALDEADRAAAEAARAFEGRGAVGAALAGLLRDIEFDAETRAAAAGAAAAAIRDVEAAYERHGPALEAAIEETVRQAAGDGEAIRDAALQAAAASLVAVEAGLSSLPLNQAERARLAEELAEARKEVAAEIRAGGGRGPAGAPVDGDPEDGVDEDADAAADPDKDADADPGAEPDKDAANAHDGDRDRSPRVTFLWRDGFDFDFRFEPDGGPIQIDLGRKDAASAPEIDADEAAR